ncbi:MAG: uracil-xanthine permease [Victivallales bacterium]|nr:uracil-xanthine permease [Victivallales bacterium]
MSKFGVREYALGVQHLLAMFGSTVLVPLITGLSPAVALCTAGGGTLLFHLCTKGIVPVFQGSSFAYIGALLMIIGKYGIPAAQSGIMAAGLVYLVLAVIVYFIGPDRLRKILPPIVTGPVIIIIGLSLTGVGVKDAFGFVSECVFDMKALQNIIIAIFVFVVVMFGMNSRWKLFNMVPILLGIVLGYVLCCVLHLCGLFQMDFTPVCEAPWLNIPFIGDKFGCAQIGNPFTVPEFNLTAILMIAPIALVTFMEHVGDITTNGAVVGKDFFKDPGLHRTLAGDGLATLVAGLLGGPANTTYSENTGVLATTKNYNPALLRIAAVFAILLGLFGKFGAVLQTIPAPVKGGIELILFGMIASVGIRTIVEAKLNMASTRNLCIMGSVLCAGIGLGAINGISLSIGNVPINISALFVATVVGVIMNAILPQDFDQLIQPQGNDKQ